MDYCEEVSLAYFSLLIVSRTLFQPSSSSTRAETPCHSLAFLPSGSHCFPRSRLLVARVSHIKMGSIDPNLMLVIVLAAAGLSVVAGYSVHRLIFGGGDAE